MNTVAAFASSIALAMIATGAFMWRFRSLAIRVGLTDIGGGRKLHRDTVPVLGGVAIFVGFCVGLLFAEPNLRPIGLRALLLTSAAMAFVGLMDDFHEFSPRTKLLCQALAGCFVATYAGIQVQQLGRLSFDGEIVNLGILTVPFTVISVIGIMNAVNMLDGLDGLASTLAVIAGFAMAVVAMRSQRTADAGVLLILVGAILGFLWFNFPHPFRPTPRSFMGDCGALFIGFVFAWFSISLTQTMTTTSPAPVDMVWILGVFLLDLFGAFFGRFLRRSNVFSPDQFHIHHLLMRSGLGGRRTVAILSLVAVAFALFGVFGHILVPSEGVRLALAVVVFASYLHFSHQALKGET
jgi:UDP-GlcNAc:undecaprenyl-phosphate/decaprenyl-phosphate GlcNAc-1-phosphate transferase